MNQFTASLWGDEAWAATISVKPLTRIVQIVSHDTAPPLYYFLLHAWMQIFGLSEPAIRSLSFLFFLGTVLTVFFIGKHFWDVKTGILAAILTLVNPFLFQYAFEGRMYALLVLTSTLSVYFFLKKNFWGFIISTTAALYTHHFAIFIVFFEFLWTIATNFVWSKKKVWPTIKPFLVVSLFYLPWIYPLYYQTRLVAGGFWLGKPNWQDFKELVRKFFTGGKNTYQNLAWYGILTSLALRKWWEEKKKALFLLGWFFVPLIVTYTLSQFFQSIFYDRYMLISIPAIGLFIASQRRKISLIPLLIIIFALAYVDYHYFLTPTKKPFREFAQMVKKEAAGLPLINYNGKAHHLWETKYYGLTAPIYSPQPLPFYTGTALMEENDVVKTLPTAKTIAVVTSSSPGEVEIAGFKTVKVKQLDSLTLLWIEKR